MQQPELQCRNVHEQEPAREWQQRALRTDTGEAGEAGDAGGAGGEGWMIGCTEGWDRGLNASMPQCRNAAAGAVMWQRKSLSEQLNCKNPDI